MTLTLGGNDVRFAEKLRACIANPPLSVCSLASEKGRAQLGKEIQPLYSKLREVYRKIKAGPNSPELYVVGYPQFVSKQFNNCALNVSLSQGERLMINEAVTYLNKVIKAAANDSGAKYVDVEDSLSGHTLCDLGESYVTGISGFGLNTEEQEMFHPNAKGHNAIFEKIKMGLGGQNLKNFTNCNAIIVCSNGQQLGEPATPSYFAEPMSLYDKAFATYTMIKDGVQSTFDSGVIAVKKGINWVAEVAPTVVQPTMAMRFELNSNPIDLGTFISNSDGSISATLNIPATVSPGIHTLRMYGKTYTGEDIEYYQVIEVQGADGDIDEDSVPDSQDSCIYIIAANTDADFDGIDDACDSNISSPQLYRVRNGNVNNNEIESYLYVERNTKASSITGAIGDYDPDGDGWALVAASQSLQDAGTVANFWVDGNKAPHVSVRTSEHGCEQYTPSDLSIVGPVANRTLNLETIEANTCRAESPNDDADGDGQADSQQALYRARNGVTNQGEDPAKLYIERSTRAAEAQLGVTDYAPNDSGLTNTNGDSRKTWSLLASSQDVSTKGTFNKLIMINQDPVILAMDINSQCIALRPYSSSSVRYSTQGTQGLEKVIVPNGEGCSL